MTTDTAGRGKAGFDHVYNQRDPREYFRALRPLSYEIPQHANGVFSRLLRARSEGSGTSHRRSGVLDVCCSYGVNAALLCADLTMEDLYQRYGDPALDGLNTDEVEEADRAFYARHRRRDAPRVVGVDVADRAVTYARQVGLLDEGWAENLEVDDPSPALAEGVDGVDLVTVTGGVGYITDRTFGRLMAVLPTDPAPWVAAFVLRMYAYDAVAAELGRHGLVTEHLSGTTFPQRRFASEEERESALQAVRARGIDTAGREEDGWYHCDLFVSRPAADVERLPLESLLADVR
jgi:SAM-dependent methyltransferase